MEAVISSLSRGPVGPGDGVGDTNKTLLMRKAPSGVLLGVCLKCIFRVGVFFMFFKFFFYLFLKYFWGGGAIADLIVCNVYSLLTLCVNLSIVDSRVGYHV